MSQLQVGAIIAATMLAGSGIIGVAIGLVWNDIRRDRPSS